MDKFKDAIKPILALMVVMSGQAYFFLCLLTDHKPNDQIIIAIVGWGGLALGYYFGSTSGSSKKDEIIQNQIDKQ